MGVIDHILCLSTAIITSWVLIIFFETAIATSTSECSIYDFPCENGDCIDSALWCDSHEDCSDGSDEKYCKHTSWTIKDPNKCPSTYFKCNSGPCIPLMGRCDGYDNCDDGSDEMSCPVEEKTFDDPEPKMLLGLTKYITTTSTPLIENVGFNAVTFFASLNASQNTLQVQQFSGLSLSGFSVQRNKARAWLLSQRNRDFGWGNETPRALMALYLSKQQMTGNNTDQDMLMLKQLEIQLFLHLERNRTQPMKLTDLGLFINALFASCKNPKNFYGDNLVAILRDDVNAAHNKNEFINPSIYLTLCGNNATTDDDVRKLQDILLGNDTNINKLDMQALAMLSTACIFKRTNFLNASMYDSLKMEFLRNVKIHGFPGNIYEAALVFQALQEMKITLSGLTSFILKQQQSDGSFGDILSTYLVLSILAARNMVQMYDYCGDRNVLNFTPLDVLKNYKSKKMKITYYLSYSFPTEVTQTMQMHVAEGTNFFNVMRLAEEINPKYRFKLSENRDVPVVYSIGGMPNDVEKGMYWTLYKASGNSSENESKRDWVPYQEDIKKLFLVEGDEVLFYYKPL